MNWLESWDSNLHAGVQLLDCVFIQRQLQCSMSGHDSLNRLVDGVEINVMDTVLVYKPVEVSSVVRVLPWTRVVRSIVRHLIKLAKDTGNGF